MSLSRGMSFGPETIIFISADSPTANCVMSRIPFEAELTLNSISSDMVGIGVPLGSILGSFK